MAAFMDVESSDDEVVIQHKQFKRQFNAFSEYSDTEFYCRYRFSKAAVIALVDRLDIKHQTKRNYALSGKDQVLLALRYYATGSYQQIIGDSFGGISQPTISRVITNVSNSLCDKIDQFIQLPNDYYAQQCKIKFSEIAGFPGVVSCIDGTHIRILKPPENENNYVNRKSYHYKRASNMRS